MPYQHKTDLRVTLELLTDVLEDYKVNILRHEIKKTQYTNMIIREADDWLNELEYYK